MVELLSMLGVHIKISDAICPRRANSITGLHMAPRLSRLQLDIRIGRFRKSAVLVEGLARVKDCSILGFLVGGVGRLLRVFDIIPSVVTAATGN